MKRCSVLFSGGLDSSFASVIMIEQGYDIDLLKMDNGALISNDLTIIRVEELRRAYPQVQINYKVIQCAGAFRKLGLVNIEKDILTYHCSMICMGCKLAMHTHNIIYCLHNGINCTVDGATKKQEKYCEQRPIAINYIRGLYKKYGIEYNIPVYECEKKEIKYHLLDREMSIYPLEDICLFSKTFSVPSDDIIENYICSKLEICDELIKRSFSYESNR